MDTHSYTTGTTRRRHRCWHIISHALCGQHITHKFSACWYMLQDQQQQHQQQRPLPSPASPPSPHDDIEREIFMADCQMCSCFCGPDARTGRLVVRGGEGMVALVLDVDVLSTAYRRHAPPHHAVVGPVYMLLLTTTLC